MPDATVKPKGIVSREGFEATMLARTQAGVKVPPVGATADAIFMFRRICSRRGQQSGGKDDQRKAGTSGDLRQACDGCGQLD